MSHVRVTIEPGVYVCSPSLPEMVSVDLRSLDGDTPLTVRALDGLGAKDGDGSTVKVGAASDGALEIHVEREDIIRAVIRGLRARVEAPVFRGEQVFVKAGHAPE